MTNNKQPMVVEWFAQQLYETLEIKGDGYVIDSLLDLAKEMEKEQNKITENTSDGYHTFKELYEFRKALR
jgi:hypothetical protein